MIIDGDPNGDKDVDFNASNTEQETEPKTKEIWLIEDRAELAGSFMRLASMKKPG